MINTKFSFICRPITSRGFKVVYRVGDLPYRPVASRGKVPDRRRMYHDWTCCERRNATQRYVTYVSCQLCPDYKLTEGVPLYLSLSVRPSVSLSLSV